MACGHVAAIESVRQARQYVCDECSKVGARWVHLRTCQACGATLCCDSSPNRHATAHAHKASHPVVASSEPGERWMYCYLDDDLTEY